MIDNEKRLFAKRLKELCDENNLPEHGRQTILCTKIGVSQEAVRKWLDAESIPRHGHRNALCDIFNVHYEWLSTGRGSKYMSLEEEYNNKQLAQEEAGEYVPNTTMNPEFAAIYGRLNHKDRQQLLEIAKTFDHKRKQKPKQKS